VRLLPREVVWTAAINSWNQYISINSLWHGRLSCTIIEGEDVAHFYRNVLFKMVWQQAKPIGAGY